MRKATNSDNILLLLTGCIEPDARQRFNKIVDVDLRRVQYIEALFYYLKNTKSKILFVENSGNDLSDIFNYYIKSGRLEILTYSASLDTKLRGKGYGEQDIIHYATTKSFLYKEAEYIIKITGRLKILNINNLIDTVIKLSNNKNKYIIGVKHWKINWFFLIALPLIKPSLMTTFFFL